MEAARTGDAVKQRRLGRGHPNLSAPIEAGEQRGTAIGIEVRGNLVEQQYRRCTQAASARHDLYGALR